MITLPKPLVEAGFSLLQQPAYLKADYGKFGQVDFETLGVEQAEKLVRKGFPFLAKDAPKAASLVAAGKKE